MQLVSESQGACGMRYRAISCGSTAVFGDEVLDDHLIMDLQREHFVPVLKPKIDGTLLRPKFANRARGATCK